MADGNYHFILRQHLEVILELQERWPTALSSRSHYMNQAEVAIQAADAIAGASQLSLHWLPSVVIDDHLNSPDKDMWGLTDFLGTDSAKPLIDSGQVTLSDILGLENQDDLDPNPKAETSLSITLNWELPDL